MNLTRCVAIALAIALAGPPAWGHTFPPSRTVVIQVEACELVVMIGYRPGSGDATEAMLARVANSPKPHAIDSLRDVLATAAIGPLALALDGKPLVPTSVRAKLGLEAGGARPMVVLLVTYALPAGHALGIASKDPRNTRISWQDHASHRVELAGAPAQDHWHDGVASFLLKLSPGVSPCVTPSSP
jgi:hypothetical protein